MSGACQRLLRSFCALTLLGPGLVMAGGGHNSTSPALGAVQLASILCNVRADSSPQGIVRNNSLNASVAARQLHRAGLCQSLAAQNPSWKGKKPPARRHYGREVSNSSLHSRGDTSLAARSAHQEVDSRDSFKQEAWFVHEGGKPRRVTKHQARKQGWRGPEAMQAADQSRLDPPLVVAAAPPAIPADPHKEALTASGPAPVALVTDCAQCETLETGRCEGPKGQASVPFKMLRPHGVVAVPRFEPGTDSAMATAEAAPRVLIRKFRTVDGVMQPDSRFSDDGEEDFVVPLPVGECVTAFTLAKDRLVVLSRPAAEQELSRVTLINLDEPDSAAQVDGGASSGLWVKGELFRYLDKILYTLAREEQKLFLYPQRESDSPRSLSSIKTVDLSSVGLANDELVSALADRETCHIAVRRRDPESEASRIHLYQVDDSGAVTEGAVITESGSTDAAWQLHFNEGQPVLFKEPSTSSDPGSLACPDTEDVSPGSQTPGHSVQKRSGGELVCDSNEELSLPVLQKQNPAKSQPSYSLAGPNYLFDVSKFSFNNANCKSTEYKCSVTKTVPKQRRSALVFRTKYEDCDFFDGWLRIDGGNKDDDKCTYISTISCNTRNCTVHYKETSNSTSDCLGRTDVNSTTITRTFITLTPKNNSNYSSLVVIGSCTLPFNNETTVDTGTSPPTEKPTNTTKRSSSTSSAGPAAILVAVTTGLGTGFLTAGLLGCESKKPPEDDSPTE